LPSKALKEIDGYPMIVFLQKRLSLLKDKIDNLILAVPEDEYNEFKDLLQPGFSLVAGDHEDVLSRFGKAFELFPADYMIRATADNPFVSLKVISDNIDLLKKNFQSVSKLQLFDYLTRENLPIGVQTEFIKNNAFWKAFEKSDKSYQREHVTPYIYENPDAFNIAKIPFPGFELISDVRLTVDTIEDYSLISRIIEEYKNNLDNKILRIDLDDILTIYKKNRPLFQINQDILQKKL
jgi:spore coat polysaccharide biosynthesis protein SpsF